MADWDALLGLGSRLSRGERLKPDLAIAGAVERRADDLGYTAKEIEQRRSSPASTEDLIRDAALRVAVGSRRLGTALITAWKLKKRAEVEEARRVLLEFIGQECVPFYVRQAKGMLRRLADS